jgi:phosphopantothenoylcysteine synthetase/decarboxylase
VSRPDVGLDADRNEVTILGRGGEQWEIPAASKAEVAEAILNRLFGGSGAGEDG